MNEFKIWNLYLHVFQQTVYLSTDKNHKNMCFYMKHNQSIFLINSLSSSAAESLYLCSALSTCVFLLIWVYIGLKFHQIMPWNSWWCLNCCQAEVTSETPKHDIPFNSPNNDTSTLWHKMWRKHLGGFNPQFKSELIVLASLCLNWAVVLPFALINFCIERFCSFE